MGGRITLPTAAVQSLRVEDGLIVAAVYLGLDGSPKFGARPHTVAPVNDAPLSVHHDGFTLTVLADVLDQLPKLRVGSALGCLCKV